MSAAHIFLFDGQGSAHLGPLPSDCLGTLSNVFLPACQDVFLKLLSSLSTDQRILSDLPEMTCYIPTTDTQLLMNPMIAIPNLYLVQVLRYLSFMEEGNAMAVFRSSEVVGYSSGLLPAVMVASSDSIPAILANAVDIFGLAFWLGFRCQCYRRKALDAAAIHDFDRDSPWSIVLFGMSRQDVDLLIKKFNSEVRCICYDITYDYCCSLKCDGILIGTFRFSAVLDSRNY